MKNIRTFSLLNEFLVFSDEYVGNHYEILLMPNEWSFEVIEAKMPGSVWNPNATYTYVAQDYEGFFDRKTYANHVTGAYYVNRLALCEYLESRKRQASCLVMRECRPEYYAPCGVGILREAGRQAFRNKPETFPTIQEALKKAQERMKLNVSIFTNQSRLLDEYGKQKRLSQWV